MLLRRSLFAVALPALGAAPAPLSAQSVSVAAVSPPGARRFEHGKEIRAAYDSTADSTRLSVVTHGGRYFLWIQRPRLTWQVAYAGREPAPGAGDTVLLDFRTQNPQAAADSRLVLLFGASGRAEVMSGQAWSDPGIQTNSHFMRFALPRAMLAEALPHERVQLVVGGVTVGFKRDQLEALRDLLSRVAPGDTSGAAPGGP